MKETSFFLPQIKWKITQTMIEAGIGFAVKHD